MQFLRDLFTTCHKKIRNKLLSETLASPKPLLTLESPINDLGPSVGEPELSHQQLIKEKLIKALQSLETQLQERITLKFPDTHRTLMLQKLSDRVQHFKSLPVLSQSIQRSDSIKTFKIVHTQILTALQQISTFQENILMPFVSMDRLCIRSINDMTVLRLNRTTELIERQQTFKEIEQFFLGCYQLSEVEFKKMADKFLQFNFQDFLVLDQQILLQLGKLSTAHKHPCQERADILSGLVTQVKSLYVDIAKQPDNLSERLRSLPITQLNQFHQFDLEAQKCCQTLDALHELSITPSSKKMLSQTIRAVEKQYSHYMIAELKPITKDTITAITQIDQMILEIQKLKSTEAPSYWNEVIESHLNEVENQLNTHNDPESVKLNTDLPKYLRQLLIPSQSIEQLMLSFTTHTEHLTGEAKKVATTLVNDLHKNIREYLKSGDFTPKATDTLLKSCRTKIHEATPELQKHRGWTKFLVNTLLSLSLIGMLLLIPTSGRQWLHHRLFRTKSASMSDHLSEKLSHFTAAIKSPTCG